MQSFNRFLTTIMCVVFGVYVGNTGICIWNYLNFPEKFAPQSAPWYTQIWVEGLATAAVLLVLLVVKLIVKRMKK